MTFKDAYFGTRPTGHIQRQHLGQFLMIAACGMLGFWRQYWGARSMLHDLLGTNA